MSIWLGALAAFRVVLAASFGYGWAVGAYTPLLAGSLIALYAAIEGVYWWVTWSRRGSTSST